jgi:Pectinacetylesterase
MNPIFNLAGRGFLVALCLAAAPFARAQEPWETVVPGGDTICSDGSPYRFFIHRGDPAKLLIEFEGGGACWNSLTCEADVYNRTVISDPEAARQTGQLQGIYDRTNPANPLKDFTHVYIPYCTGDLHWGNAATKYTSLLGKDFVVQHKGAVNASTALNWAGANVPAPSQVVVAGCSAGGYGAALWSAKIAKAYPGARMVELADSAAGVVPDGFFAVPVINWNVADAWPTFIPDLALDKVDPATLSLPKLYTEVASFYPAASFSQFNVRTDSVQIFFYELSKASIAPTDTAEWSAKMVANVEQISAQNPNFRAYIAAGSDHCIINRASFYTQTVGGRKFSDWVTTLLAGGDPGQVR